MDYCWCSDDVSSTTPQEDHTSHNSVKFQAATSNDEDKSTKEHSEPLKQRKRKNNMPDVAENLNNLLEQISNNQQIHFKATTKSSRGLHNGTSKRRSQFIGVLRNGHRWQVLINVGKKKRYIGTYEDEQTAALVHDFFSIGINCLNAKTNFSYDQELVKDMIAEYLRNQELFDPTAFVQRIQGTQ